MKLKCKRNIISPPNPLVWRRAKYIFEEILINFSFNKQIKQLKFRSSYLANIIAISYTLLENISKS